MHSTNTDGELKDKSLHNQLVNPSSNRSKDIIGAARTVFLLLSSTVLGSGLALVTNLMLAKSMGPNGFGAFSASLVCVTVVSPLAGLGIDLFLLKVFGQEGWNAQRWISPVLRFVCFSSFAVVSGLVLYSFIGHVGRAELILMMTPLVFAQVASMLACSKFQLEERYSQYAMLQSATSILRFLGIFTVSAFFAISPTITALIYGAVALLIFAYAISSIKELSRGCIHLKGHGSKISDISCGSSPAVKDVVKESWQFGMNGFLYLLYYQSSIVLLSTLVGEREAGEFNAVNLIIGAAFLFPSVLFQRYLMPKLHRWSNNNLKALQVVYSRGSLAMLVSGGGAGLIVFFFSAQLIELFFGKSFDGSAPILALLSVCIPIRFLAAPADAILTSGKQLIAKIRILGFAAVLCLVLNMTLISSWGIYAAAFSMIVCEVYIAISLHMKAVGLIRTSYKVDKQ